MKPVLVIGLGNPLMGDEGIGLQVAERLAADPRLPGHGEVVCGGTDLLRYAAQMEGRSRVVLIDAVQDGSEPGSVAVWDDLSALDDRQEHAHHLSVVQAVKLLKMIVPARFTLAGVSISSAGIGPGLSPAVADRVPAIVNRVLQELA
jgi:hydrogenase maturation protease